MDMLRWILLLVGLLVIAGLYGYYRWQENGGSLRLGRRSGSKRRRPDHDVDSALKDLDDLVIDDPDAVSGDLDVDLDIPVDDAVDDRRFRDDPTETVSAPRVRSSSLPDEPEGGRQEPVERGQAELPGFERPPTDDVLQDAGQKIVVLHVVAGAGYCFTGPALVDAAKRVGLRHGEHSIFHHTMDTRSGRVAVYSMASMVEPGTFEPDRVEEMETPGVALFMQLPAPFDGLTAFEQMLETARRLADKLDGHVLDAQRCDLTQQSVEHIREELREYRRLAHLAARKQHG
ncbi:MAG: cell division protein ZipA [Ectothiorhodospiraceae bacterium]|nr:cell division protein ZipA [Ectothiorhodospiraceae bacterium]MCH8503572.1 cell division protein ZipA [Ectothiorhodospiraceae bacterium]